LILFHELFLAHNTPALNLAFALLLHILAGRSRAPRRFLKIRAKRGFLGISLSRDPQNRDVFFLYERWANFDSLVQHFDKPWTKKIFIVMDELLARPVQVKVLLVAAE
jgi:quinol monooxygenase YgiN